MSGATIGIDLGTTHTVVAAVRDGRATALADESGNRLLPSVVSFHADGTALVGPEAKKRRVIDPENTVYSIKRLIGRSYRSEEVKRARERFPFELREGPGQAALISARGETYTLPEISAFVLKEARALAERALGESVQKAVVTVPANFNDLQRAATKVAGRVAGLEVLRILNEPTAAALAYGFGKASQERIAVYDFGGGTFDVTYLDHSGNLFEVLATAGDTFLGGEDVDAVVVAHLAEEIRAAQNVDPMSHPSGQATLREAAEALKIKLTAEPTASVEVKDVMGGSTATPLPFTCALTRAKFEELTGPLVTETLEVCKQALDAARLRPEDFDQVILVGGSTRMPIVRRKVDEFFGGTVLDRVNPEEVVALGAAIQAAALSGADRRAVSIPTPPKPAAATPAPTAGKPAPPRRRGVDTSPTSGEAPRSSGAPSTTSSSSRKPFSTGVGLGPKREEPSTDGGVAPPRKVSTDPGLDAGGVATSQRPSQGAATVASAGLAGDARRAIDQATKGGPDLPSPVPHADLPGTHDSAAAALPLVHPSEQNLPAPGSPESSGLPARTASDSGPGGHGAERPSLRDRYGDLPVSMAGDLSPRKDLPDTVGAPLPARASNPGGATMAVPTVSSALRPPAHPGETSMRPGTQAPLLVDVTPLSLHVETVAGYCDTIVARNTPVPCSETRRFVTGLDGQTVVHVRVSQGESSRFSENTLLGAIELSGLPPAPRGKVAIEITFSLDTNGVLNVVAKDVQSGKDAQAALRLVGTAPAAQLHAAPG